MRVQANMIPALSVQEIGADVEQEFPPLQRQLDQRLDLTQVDRRGAASPRGDAISLRHEPPVQVVKELDNNRRPGHMLEERRGESR
jgi:hypothetical protein